MRILTAILMMSIGIITNIATQGASADVMIFSLTAGGYFIYDSVKEIKYGKTHS